MSVWQQATEYLMCSIRDFRLSADYADFTDMKINKCLDQPTIMNPLISFSLSA